MTRPHPWRRLALSLVLASSLGALAPSASAADTDTNPNDARAQSLNALVGAETGDQGIQALAFLPNDISANVGDTITWSFPTHEPHTLTFVPAGSPRPPASTPATPNGGTLDGTKLINSGVMQAGGSFSVKVGASGDFVFVCLIHGKMSGTLHAQPAGSARDEDGSLIGQGNEQGADLLNAGRELERDELADVRRDTDAVTVGSGLIQTTSDGDSSVMIARFLPGTRQVHVGDTVDWTALDPATPHTVTFGPAPASPAAVVNVSFPAPGTTGSNTGTAVEPTTPPGLTVSSGFLLGPPAAHQHVNVTFNAPGTYNYYCALHFALGMMGTIIVS